MEAQIYLQTILNERLNQLKRQNPSFSLRSFSRRLGIHSGALSSILNGKRVVSRKLAERIASNLMLDPNERIDLLKLFPSKTLLAKRASSCGSLTTQHLKLSVDQFKLVAQWEHNAILALVTTKDQYVDVSAVAIRLGISETRTEHALDRLLELGLIERTQDGVLKRTCKQIRTTDGIADVSIRKAHEESLELAKTALFDLEVTERDISSITMAINIQNLAKAHELIRKFQDDLADLLENGDQTEVYRFTALLFPLTRLKKIK